MKFIFLIALSFFMINKRSVSQNFEIKQNGLNDILLGTKINYYQNQNIEPQKNYVEKLKTNFLLTNFYDYYFVKSDSIQINNVGKPEDIFIATNKSGDIVRIIFFIKNEFLNINFINEITKVYNNKVLLATSGIGNNGENILMHWTKNNYSLHVRKQYGSEFTKIMMNKYSENGIAADITKY